MECSVCTKPLGCDSIDSGYTLCHDCRRCRACNTPVSAKEIQWCYDNGYPVKHARCLIASDGPQIKSTGPLKTIEVLNMCHLLIADKSIVEGLLVNMNFDQKFTFLQGMQTIAAETSVLIRKDKAAYEAELKTRAAEGYKAAKAQVEAQANSLPSVKRKVSKLDKFILTMSALGIDRDKAIEIFKAQGETVQ